MKSTINLNGTVKKANHIACMHAYVYAYLPTCLEYRKFIFFCFAVIEQKSVRIFPIMMQAPDLAHILYKGHPSRK